jgi:hypothetical protein
MEIGSSGIHFRNHTFCSDECCEEFEAEFVDKIEPVPDELVDDDLVDDDLVSDDDDDLGYRDDDEDDEVDPLDDDFDIDPDDF